MGVCQYFLYNYQNWLMVFWLQVFKPLTTYRAIYIYIIQIRYFLWVHWIDNKRARCVYGREPSCSLWFYHLHGVWGSEHGGRRSAEVALTLTAMAFQLFVSSPSIQRRHHPSRATALEAWEKTSGGKEGSRFTPVCCHGNQPTDVGLRQCCAGKVSPSVLLCSKCGFLL